MARSSPPTSFIEVGVVIKPHGYKGGVLVRSPGGRDSALSHVRDLFIGDSPSSLTPISVLEADWMPRGWRVVLKGVEGETAANALRGQKLFVQREALPTTRSNEFYVVDLIGATVKEEETGRTVGTFAGVEPLEGNAEGTSDRWWIETEEDPIAILSTKRYVSRVDTENRVIWVQNLKDFE